MLDFLKVFRPIVGDFLSTIFFIAVYEVTKSIIIATGVGIAVGVLQFVWLKVRRKDIALMQWASLALVLVLGSATMLTANPRFVMLKPSISGFAIAIVMLQRGWQLRYMPLIVKENAGSGFLVMWGYLWSLLYFVMSAINLYIVLAIPSVAGKPSGAWTAYNATVSWAAPVALFVIQYVTMRLVVRRNVVAKMSAAMSAAPAE
jgi:intracellular septation protein A